LYTIYQLIGWLIFIVVSPFFLIYSFITGKHWQGLGQRLGFVGTIPRADGPGLRIWLHAASVGEVQVARALVAEIQKQLPGSSLLLSTVTRQGLAVAKKQLKGIRCILAPLDLYGIVNRALQAFQPDLYICLETELWPGILHQARKNGCRLLLLNGRLSERSFRNYLKIRGFMGDILSGFEAIAVIQKTDAARYTALGATPEQLKIVGNAKYDLGFTMPEAATAEKYRNWLGLRPDQPVFLAGSTHTGEEELLVEVYRHLQEPHPDLVWLIAPRHLSRLDELKKMLAGRGLEYDCFSAVKKAGRRREIILVDTMGDLAGLYSVARYIFCGGSLVNRGGHNILEAAVWGKPVVYGPSMKDFADAKELLESAQAGFPVTTPQEAADIFLQWARSPDDYEQAAKKAKDVALAQQGSARRQVELIRSIVDSCEL
jgi:3-deoxy-D-manno-octulosonic-acid transferase